MSKHISFLLNESIEYLNIKPDGIYVDCTLGGGGHSSAILSHLTTGHLYAFDQDTYAIERAEEKLQDYQGKYTIIEHNFRHITEELHQRGIDKVDGILFDLGVSSFQFDIPERGFSYNHDAPLDMRMNQDSPLTAETIVNEYSYSELLSILFRYGEEQQAKRIVREIEKVRKDKRITTTFELVDVIKQSLPQKILNKKGHPAKKTFQALRIAVNNELEVFLEALEDAISLLAPKGRLAVITFHSLEDRICKQIFRKHSTIDIPKGVPIIVDEDPELRLINRKVIIATEDELEVNNRAHSAKLRVVEKIK